jgi:hypothetical protein
MKIEIAARDAPERGLSGKLNKPRLFADTYMVPILESEIGVSS